jgi:hypothetical protein
MPTTVWLRHNALQKRYTCSRNSVDRLHGEGHLPPPSYPLNKAPLWALELLDFWDSASPDEQKAILESWPNWRETISALAAARDPQAQRAHVTAKLAEASARGRASRAKGPGSSKPKRRKRKQRRNNLQEATA